MEIPEPKVHSFIVKLRLEEAVDESGKAVWRGYVTHVPDGERCYLKQLSDLVDFIGRYVDGLTVERSSWFRRMARRFGLGRSRH